MTTITQTYALRQRLRELAESALPLPWERSLSDVPYEAKRQFTEAATPDNIMDLFRQLDAAKAEVSKYRDLHAKAYDMVVRLQHERDELKTEEPAAFRHSFDGYGWLYCDDGSGSSWKEMVYPDKEFLFTRKMPTIERLEADDTEGGAL